MKGFFGKLSVVYMRAREARKLTGGEGVETGFRTNGKHAIKRRKVHNGAQRCIFAHRP